MIGIDTNVLARYITQDDPEQAPPATKFIESLDEQNQGFVSLVVLVELHWVLRRAYKIARAETIKVISDLLDSRELCVQNPELVRRVLLHAEETDFADGLISELGHEAGCEHTVTFDQRATRLPGMRHVAD